MNRFRRIELEDGEKLAFGPVTRTKTTTFSAGPGGAQGSGFGTPGSQLQQEGISWSSGHTVGITNRRVIVEDLQSPDKSKIVPNEAVSRVFIRRKGDTFAIAKVQTASGQTFKLNLGGIPIQDEPLLQQTFPQAEITTSSGILSSKGCLIALIVVGVLAALACVGPLILSAVGSLLFR